MQNNSTWYKQASRKLKSELQAHGINYNDLKDGLNAIIGINESYAAIASKINRGSFSLAFYLQCLKVIDSIKSTNT